MSNSVTGSAGPPMKIRSAHDAVSAVPYLLGFHPVASLVAIGYDGPHNTCALRLDLPQPADRPDPEEVDQLASRTSALLARNGFRQALLLGYGPVGQVAPAVEATRRALAESGVEVRDALRVADGRWWSLTCQDGGCCPPEGTPFDISTSVVAAQATLAGQVAFADRSELARTVAPITGPARRAMRQATDRAEERFLTVAAGAGDPQQIRALMVAEAVPLLTELTARTPDEDPPSDDEIAWLGLLLTNLRVRDEAWVRMDADHPQPHITFWRDMLRRVEEPYAAAPGCLLAYAAYAAGDGGLANVALDRALDADPDYTLTTLLRQIIHAGIPPSQARLRMTPDELARAYAEQEETD